MSTAAPVNPPPVSAARHPLGLPAGSVRAALVLLIVIPFWLILLVPHPEKPVQIPLFFYFMVGLVMLFFASHGSRMSVGGEVHQHPWGLPGWLFRWLILLGTLAVIGYRAALDKDLLVRQLTPQPDQLTQQWVPLAGSLLGGFLFGWLCRQGPWRNETWFQDIQAWVSLLGMFGLLLATLLHLFINPSLGEQLNLTIIECIVTAIVACYFGFRS